jgi:DNA-binding winged helix-turn-helix (wHTH) protein/tetratricopeptide (TPR) repeat protein
LSWLGNAFYAARVLKFDAFELDEERFELRHDGQVIELRRKVFDVLCYLVTHSDRLVTKEELLEAVWPREAIHEAVVAQNIAILRKVFGDKRDSAKVIQTVHGRGYRFVASVTRPEQKSARAASQPFIGRESILAGLEASLDDALGGRGHIVVISGEPGIGKTSTVDRLGARALERGMRVLAGRCYEGEGAPAYWPWTQILRAAAGQGDRVPVLAALSSAEKESGALRSEPLDSAEARFRLFQGVAEFLARVARAQPLLLVIDDLHWADDATLHLLRFLTRELRTLPVLVAATTRDVAHPQTAAELVLSALIGAPHVRRVYLGGLSQAETQQLVAATLPGALSASTLQEVYALTEGNPFFVSEVTRLLADDAGTLEVEQRLGAELPRRVREVIALRMQGLDSETRRVLSIASVIGREFNLAVLAQVAELPRAELLALLERASAARVAREVAAGDDHAPPGQYRFVHALIRETLYGALTEPQRVRYHAQVGRALEAQLGVDAEAHASELAQHFYRAASSEGVERAVFYCRRAAEQALELLAFEQAVHYYRRALDALSAQLPVDELLRFSLKLALGSALFRAGEDGNPSLLGAAEIARRLGRPDLIGAVVLAMCGWPRFGKSGRTANLELMPLLREALAVPLADDALRVRLLCVHALNDREVPFDERVERTRDALAQARALGNDEVLHDALLPRILLLQTPEATEERLSLATELCEVAERLGSKERMFAAYELRVQPLLALGDLGTADREIARCEMLASELRLPRCALSVLRFQLERALGDGRLDEIRALTREAVRVHGQAENSPGYQVSMFMWRTHERVLRGDRPWFERHVDDLASRVDRSMLLRGHVAYMCAAFGRLEQARACYQPLLDPRFLDSARDEDWLMGLVHTADAAGVCRDAEAARSLYPRLLPHAALNVTHFGWLIYFGSCAHWLGVLAALIGEADGARAHFEAALDMNTRMGARPAQHRTEFEYAKLLMATEPPRARELLRSARSGAERIGMLGLSAEANALLG